MLTRGVKSESFWATSRHVEIRGSAGRFAPIWSEKMPCFADKRTYSKHKWRKFKGRQKCERCGKRNSFRVPFHIRFWDHVRKTRGCWLWQGNIGWNGYGLFTLDKRDGSKRKPWRAHRLAWFLKYGSVPGAGMDLHHKCNTRNCVKPAHLEPLSHRENIRKAVCKRVCKRGHEQVEENRYYYKNGTRSRCRLCLNVRRKERRTA
jgi:hypothetical protein